VINRLACCAAAICGCIEARAQQTNQLECQGVMGDTPAVLSGLREYAPYNPIGDGYVRFEES